MALKIIFMGTPAFAVPALRALIDSPHHIVAAYSQPPRPAGRGQKLTPSPVHQLAESHGIPVFIPTSLKSPEIQQEYRDLRADVTVVAAYGLLLPKAILDGCPLGCINIHPSDLPRWRGAAPIQRTVMAGDRETAICIMQMDEGLDTGAVLLRQPYPLAPYVTSGELHDQLSAASAPLLLTALDELEKGTATPQPQPSNGITYASKITKEEANIDWSRPAADLLHHIHGLNPFPGAWFEHQGERFKVLRARAIHQETGKAPGTVLDQTLSIQCGQGILLISEIQRQGKAPMTPEALLNGYPIPVGTVLS